jgi:hypothetical protein
MIDEMMTLRALLEKTPSGSISATDIVTATGRREPVRSSCASVTGANFRAGGGVSVLKV